jgi:Zn-dependent M32 family carboxypeptidase
MDKLKSFLPVVKKYHFWVLSGVVVAVALLSWFKATTDMADRIKKRKEAISKHYKNMTEITGQPQFPNPTMLEAINKKIAVLKADVAAAWQTFYGQQNQYNKLPEELSKEFKDAFVKPGEALTPRLCQHYQYFTKATEVPKLFEMIGDPINGALWSGPPFENKIWLMAEDGTGLSQLTQISEEIGRAHV